MKLYDNSEYKKDLSYVANIDFPWGKLKNKSVMISGATGLIGSFLIDTIMWKNQNENLNCTIYALGRNKFKAENRFGYCRNERTFKFIPYDINRPLVEDGLDAVDFIIHLASNTHPVAYATDPIGTIMTNIIGTQKYA